MTRSRAVGLVSPTTTSDIESRGLYIPRRRIITGPPLAASTLATWWAGDLKLADGDPVDSWTDRVRGVAVTNTSTARPTFRANAINGRPALQFDGVNDYLESATLSSATTGSVVAVIKDTTAGGAVWAQSLASSTVVYAYQIASATGAAALRYDHSNGSDAIIKVGATVLTSGTFVTEVTCPANRAISMSIGGVPEGVGTTLDSGALPGWFSSIGTNRFTIGSLAYSSTHIGFLNGYIAFLGVYDAPLSTEDRAALVLWLRVHYGLAL